MNRPTKSIVLFILLAFPVLIFIFLKLFGVNQYDLPVYYSQGVDTTFTDCEFSNQPHLIPDYVLPQLSGKELKGAQVSGSYTVYYFSQNTTDRNYTNTIDQLARVQGSFDAWKLLNFVMISNAKQSNEFDENANSFVNDNLDNWYYTYANPVYTNQLARCGLILQYDASDTNVNQVVILVDNNGAIRGYYAMNDEEEVDRLIVELKILRDNHQSS